MPDLTDERMLNQWATFWATTLDGPGHPLSISGSGG